MESRQSLSICFLMILAQFSTLIVTSSGSPAIPEISSSDSFSGAATNGIRAHRDRKGRQESDFAVRGPIQAPYATTSTVPSEDAVSQTWTSLDSSDAVPSSENGVSATESEELNEVGDEPRFKRSARRMHTAERQLHLQGPNPNMNIINAPMFRTTSPPVRKRCPSGTQLSHGGRCRRFYGGRK